MRSAFVLILATTFYLSVKYVECSRFGYEVLISEIEYLKSSLISYQKELKNSKQQTLELQAQLQQQVSRLTQANERSEENHRIQNQQLLQEIKQFNLWQQNLKQVINLHPGLFSADFQWVSWSSEGEIPPRAAAVKHLMKEVKYYVGRVYDYGYPFAVKINPSNKRCYSMIGGKEIEFEQCEILTGSKFLWQWSPDGKIPANAFPCGRFPDGELQFIGRLEQNRGSHFSSEMLVTINRREGTPSSLLKGKPYLERRYYVLIADDTD